MSLEALKLVGAPKPGRAPGIWIVNLLILTVMPKCKYNSLGQSSRLLYHSYKGDQNIYLIHKKLHWKYEERERERESLPFT